MSKLHNVPCDLPPEGWTCSRGKGHEGPCAATPIKPPEQDFTKREILVIYNNHVADCSVPPKHTNRDRKPKADDERGNYYGYYENCYGEQFIFVYDYDKEVGKLWAGDCDWKKPISVVEITQDGIKAQAAKDGKEDTAVEALKSEHPLIACKRLANGNLLHAGEVMLGVQEMNWLRSCWETCRTYYEMRQARRART